MARQAEKQLKKKPRRWVVERTLAWLSKCRGILVRHNKRARYYLGLIQIACALFWFRRLVNIGAVVLR
jgi:putative transposase